MQLTVAHPQQLSCICFFWFISFLSNSLCLLGRNQVTDLIARHKDAEVRRMDVEKAYQTELDAKQAEMEEHRKEMERVREFHEGLATKARIELHEVRQEMEIKNQEEVEEIANQVGVLVELKHKDSKDMNEPTKEKEYFNHLLGGEWKKVEQYEMKLAGIELEKRRSLARAEHELERQHMLLDTDKAEELKHLEEQQVTINY